MKEQKENKQEKKSGRGGKREGAGRKSTKAPPVDNQSTPPVVQTQASPFVYGRPTPPAPVQQAMVVAPRPIKSVKRGVVIIALGDPQYGRMAANLAASIRFTDKDTPIHVVYSGNSLSHLTEQHRKMITSTAECPAELMTKNGKVNYIKAKTCIYHLSPFDETLMLDADMLWFSAKPVKDLMDKLSEFDFTIQNRGVHDFTTGKTEGNYTHWCDVNEAKEAYNLKDKFYQLSSEFLYFKKTPLNRKFFRLAQDIFDKPKVKPSFAFGSSDIPDELAYNIASAVMGIYPPKEHTVFIFWSLFDTKATMHWPDILAKYYGYSMGGNRMTANAIQKYDSMAKAHALALRLPYHFKLYPKNQWDRARQTI